MIIPILMLSLIAGADLSVWKKCKQNTDCVAVPGVCETHESVNKKFRKDYELYLEKQIQLVRCAPPAEAPHPLTLQKGNKATPEKSVKSTPKCINKMCTLVVGSSKNG